ncbi:MAG: hypothetical protein RLZZ09_805 [Pseudomonadota bacterium]|jgi:hypothetical protein
MENRFVQLGIIAAYWAASMVLMWAIYSISGRGFQFDQALIGTGLGTLVWMVAELRAARK